MPPSISLSRLAKSSFALLLLIGLDSPSADGWQRALELRLLGSPEIVLRAEDMTCAGQVAGSQIDVTDMPASAFRRDDGTVILLAGNKSNYYLAGPSLDSVRRVDCQSLLPSAKNPDPAEFRDNEWLFNVHVTEDGRAVGFVHNEYHGEDHHEDCIVTSRRNRECWYAAVTMVVSNDGGRSFQRPAAPHNVLLALPYEFSTDANRAGVRSPKVVQDPRNGMVYVFVNFMDRNRGINAGQCLLRGSGNGLRDWRIWTGKAFEPYVASAYQGRVTDCVHVLKGTIFSVKYIPEKQLFVAVGATRNKVFYRFSSDLINWTPSETLMWVVGKGNYKGKKQRQGQNKHPEIQDPTWYYSLLDPKSDSKNFDTITMEPYLYFVRYRTDGGKLINKRRDVMRIPVRIQP